MMPASALSTTTTTTLPGLRPSLLMAPLRIQELSPALQKYHSIPFFNATENTQNEKMALPDAFTVILSEDSLDVDADEVTWPPVVTPLVKEIFPDSLRAASARRIPSVHTPPSNLWKINTSAMPISPAPPPALPSLKRSTHPIAPPGLNLNANTDQNLPLLFSRFSTNTNTNTNTITKNINPKVQAPSTPPPIGSERGRSRSPRDLSTPEREKSRFTFAQPVHPSPLVYTQLMQYRKKIIDSFSPIVPSHLNPSRLHVSEDFYTRYRKTKLPIHRMEHPSVYTRRVHSRSRTFCDRPLAGFSHRDYLIHGNSSHCIKCARDTLSKRLLTSRFYAANPSYFPGQPEPKGRDLRSELEDAFDDGMDFDRQWTPESPRLPDRHDFDFELEDDDESDDDRDMFSPGKSYLDLSSMF